MLDYDENMLWVEFEWNRSKLDRSGNIYKFLVKHDFLCVDVLFHVMVDMSQLWCYTNN